MDEYDMERVSRPLVEAATVSLEEIVSLAKTQPQNLSHEQIRQLALAVSSAQSEHHYD